ncbi:hypothetical protein KY312_03830 [Candidatus Woesearchaeota archaeon]|nr:hypothetical protein [Candidatus Woesearchaeota archaeon]
MKLQGEPIIQYVGLKSLSDEEQEMTKTLATEYQDKIQKEMEIPVSLVVHIKKYKSEGKKAKFSVNIKTVAASQTYEVKRAADWDLARAMHKAFKNMERLVLHKTHTDTQHKRVYS